MAGPNFWGDLVRHLRQEQGITQRRLAMDTGVNRNTLGNIERGSCDGDMGTMEKLLGHLGYELEAMSVTPRKPREKTACLKPAKT